MVTIVEDRRIGTDHPVYRYVEGSALVQVPDEVRKCVAFVMYQAADGLHFAGTAFFAGEPLGDTGKQVTWVITAAHVINGVASKSIDQLVRLRINLKAGSSGYIAVPVDKWTHHPSDDVAVVSIPIPETFQFLHYGLGPTSYVTPDVISLRAIGVGDEVFLTGLFVNHPGKERMIPIVRSGNIAAMPAEPIRSRSWGEIRGGYLIEARSIGGLSGSPVFLYAGNARRQADGKLERGVNPILYLLGLMHGHFPGELSEADMENPDAKEQINMGIAVVVPVESIIETINQPRFVMDKRAKIDELEAELAAAPDQTDALAEQSEPIGLDSREDFEAALRKVSRKTAPEGTKE